MSKNTSKNESKLEVPLFDRALKALAERGTLVHEGDKVRRTTFKVKLSREDAECAAEIERAVRDTRFNTPRIEELYTLAQDSGVSNVKVIIAPNDLRVGHAEIASDAPSWIGELYRDVGRALDAFPIRMETRNQ